VTGPSRPNVLLVRAGARVCALRLADVIETLRPLPVAPLAGTPAFVRGVAVVRGAPIPVIDLDALLGGAAARPPTRFVVVRVGERRAALAVEEVVGIVALGDGGAEPRSPLLEGAAAGALEELRSRDDALVVVLAAARLVGDDVWRAMGAPRAEA
jgi:purine-binding chemotaxis protein CheW